jgi:hypothetical protein
MSESDEDARQKARKRAEEMQASLEHTVEDERDTQALLERLDKLAAELFDLAQDWDPIDVQMAARVRKQEDHVHELRTRVEHLGEMEADEAEKIIAAIRQELRRARES